MLSKQVKDEIYDTVWCIAASPFVSEYMIGYTRRRSRQRLAEYWRQHGYQHLVVVANGLNLSDARLLEEYLQTHIWKSDENDVLFQKYSADRRLGRHVPSIGPMPDNEDDGHTIYMAWRDDVSDYETKSTS